MRARRLGKNGPDISAVGFGAWEAGGTSWGPNVSDDGVVAAMQAGFDAGMNWIDTAEVYGDGQSERLVGRAVAGRRDQVLVFTKVGASDGGTGHRPEQVRAAIRASLGRLGLDHVDLYQLHWPETHGVPVEETWGAMSELVAEGLTRHIGVSNFDRDLLERCRAVAPVDSLQNELSLVAQADRADYLPWLTERDITYLAYSPLGAGLLTGALSADSTFDAGDWRRGEAAFQPGAFTRNLERVDRMRAVAMRLGTTTAGLALAWVLAVSDATVAIAGSRDPAHARDNAAAGNLELDAATLEELDAIFA